MPKFQDTFRELLLHGPKDKQKVIDETAKITSLDPKIIKIKLDKLIETCQD